ncbi:MAG TPA: amidohydrolase family protein, partial [Chthoniobacterales bacterium]
TPLGSETLFAIYETAADLDLVIFVHPLRPVGVDRIGRAPEYGAVAAFPLETALAAVSMMAGGVLARFPNLRVLLSHGGGALPWILPRLDYGRTLGGAVAADISVAPSELAQKFWYDTVLYSERSLRFLADSIGEDHIVVGSDYPFTIRQKQPGDFAARALGIDSPALSRNAERLLALDMFRGSRSRAMAGTRS